MDRRRNKRGRSSSSRYSYSWYIDFHTDTCHNDSTREEGDHWTYTMTLHDRTAYAYYTEGAKKNGSYTVIPFNVSEIADGLESIYTYTCWVNDGRTQGHKCFAIGKVKGT
jgi:hypothetical protein